LNGLVPIVEPEILTDGDHDIVARSTGRSRLSQRATRFVLRV